MENHQDVVLFPPCASSDPEYAQLLNEAKQSEVEILVDQCRMKLGELALGKSIPFELN